MFISVDLPAPFSPSSAWTSPRRRSKSTRSSATTPGNRFVMPRISRTVAASTADDSKDLLLKRRGTLSRFTESEGGPNGPALSSSKQGRLLLQLLRNVKLPGDDLRLDLVHRLDERLRHAGVDLADAHAAVGERELEIVVALELPGLGRLDHVEDTKVDVLDAADQNPLGVLRLIL